KSLNAVATEALARGLSLEAHPVKRRDLRTIAGGWVRDRDVEQALDEQRVIERHQPYRDLCAGKKAVVQRLRRARCGEP
ncbi:MAG TPA: hypothetical protein VH165_09190, partial [Kofleriaceae bacterium]|nr:hypothetical protein [Kofleriaceae bacterium]